MRNTKQKQLILQIINNSINHLNAFEVYEEARKSMPNISLGTVYRNLNMLIEEKNARRLKAANGIDRFDNTKTQHHHFVCMKCGKYYDIFDKIELKNLKENYGIIKNYEVQINGICNDCLKEEEK